MLGDMKFLESLKEYDKDNIPAQYVKKIREKYIPAPDFDPAVIKNVSSACEGLCKWVKAINIYDQVAKVRCTINYHYQRHITNVVTQHVMTQHVITLVIDLCCILYDIYDI